jgi:hypothetical protein
MLDHLGNVAIGQPADIVGGGNIEHTDRVALHLDGTLLLRALASNDNQVIARLCDGLRLGRHSG